MLSLAETKANHVGQTHREHANERAQHEIGTPSRPQL
jgi:hypothetical protein